MKKIAVLVLIGFVVLGLNSCILDPKKDDPGDQPPPSYRDLQLRDDVFFNLQQAYNNRNLERYEELLDDDFIFFFSNTDVQSGAVQYAQWERAAEVNATRNLFDPNFTKPGLEPASSINLRLDYAAGEDKWVEVTPPDPIANPEKWYEKIVKYSLTVKSGVIDYVGYDIQASFVVRYATDSEGKQYWRIIMWRDETGS
jgi:hypothetical protein